uniref:pilin n=1 Tax=Candidatus Electronema sp. TaxID=2698783 RepID=UPI004055FB80
MLLSNRRRYFIELLHVIVIISILVVLAIKSYQVMLAKAEVTSMVYRFHFASAKTGNLMYLALHGEFPQNTEQALALLPPENWYIEPERKVVIEQGAVHVSSSTRRLAGKTLTMRPVVQEDDPTGAVHWVCGNKKESGWKVFGVDRTDIEDRHIPAVLK